jgi:diphthine synthase
MHTLCLLDIKVKEPDYEMMAKGKGIRYRPPRFMTVNTAIDQLLDVEATRKEGVLSLDSLAVGMARLGQDSQCIRFGTLAQLQNEDFGLPLHCMALCGDLHPLEVQYLELFRVKS